MKNLEANAIKFSLLILTTITSYNSLCQPPHIKYSTCEKTIELAKEELKGDTIKYFHFGDFSKSNSFFVIIDSLAKNMRIKLVDVTHYQPLECYNEEVKSYFRKYEGIDDIWIYLNVKADSLVNYSK